MECTLSACVLFTTHTHTHTHTHGSARPAHLDNHPRGNTRHFAHIVRAHRLKNSSCLEHRARYGPGCLFRALIKPALFIHDQYVLVCAFFAPSKALRGTLRFLAVAQGLLKLPSHYVSKLLRVAVIYALKGGTRGWSGAQLVRETPRQILVFKKAACIMPARPSMQASSSRQACTHTAPRPGHCEHAGWGQE